jgi:hypothetical protein
MGDVGIERRDVTCAWLAAAAKRGEDFRDIINDYHTPILT